MLGSIDGLFVTAIGVVVGDAVLTMIGVIVVGAIVVMVGVNVFVGASVGSSSTGCSVVIGFRVGTLVGCFVVGAAVATTGDGVTFNSGSSIRKIAGITIPPRYSIGSTRNRGMTNGVGDGPSSHNVGQGNAINQQRMTSRKDEYRKQQLPNPIFRVSSSVITLEMHRSLAAKLFDSEIRRLLRNDDMLRRCISEF